jgi:hypothetical protein
MSFINLFLGDHARFEDRIGSTSYLLYFHNMVTATGAENIESLTKAELSRDVFSESSVPGLPATTAQLQKTMHGFHTREPHESSTREHCGHPTPRKKLTMRF